ILILGMLKTKDPAAFLGAFGTKVDKLYGVAIPGEDASRPADDVVSAAAAAGISAETSEGIDAALRTIAAKAEKDAPPIVLICGSLYLAGHVLALNETS
ncbi:MAG TPA: bifunctional folylpolyglutamate synthase/dihydrofolate synthase, partial [Alphaproteobacteria bacterium]|nr:bifunctional folylpolyglutamate synthase/dihydrofolate synthase [Alphaproteobacteria bacterium]